MLDDDSYWIGYEHIFGSIWRWPTTGKSGSFQKWDIGEPDGEGKCTRMTPYVQGIWRDWDCDRKLKFICKKYAGESTSHIITTQKGLEYPSHCSELQTLSHLL